MGEHKKLTIADEPEPDVKAAHAGHGSKPYASHIARLKNWYLDHKLWAIPASVLLFGLVVIGVPATRYGLAGLAVKKDLTVKVLDTTANTPVSGAVVSAGGVSVQTDGNGVAKIPKQKAGHHTLLITKKYYASHKVDALVPIFGHKAGPQIAISATGRQVKIIVTNLINKKSLGDVDIAVAGITAKTDKNGAATIVLPVGTAQQSANLSLDGYIKAKVIVKVSNNQTQLNNFSLTPNGKVYFLSKLSGKIDVVKTNLDGSDRQTVLAGTGNEDDRNTVLLASRDWKYLALLSRRAGGVNPSIYMIDTSDDSLTTMDEGTADFTLVGWVDNSFVYTVNRREVPTWQANAQAIKSFSAATKKITILDHTQANGTSGYDYIAQQLGSVYGYNGQVFYYMDWQGNNEQSQLAGQQVTFKSVKPDGTGAKTIKSFAPDAGSFNIFGYGSMGLNERIEKPDEVHFEFYSSNGGTKYYVYSGGQFKDEDANTSSTFFGSPTYPTYLQSPSGDNTFWTEPRDGKNTLFIGDEDGENEKQIATLSDYNVYGWFSDDYLLVSKNSSELYIMPVSSIKNDSQAIKITDYHKPVQSYYGYGGGYGGL